MTPAPNPTIDWPAWRARTPAASSAPLAVLLDDLPRERWPVHADWTRLADARQVVNTRGLPLRFVVPSLRSPGALDFERRIAMHGEVETRPACWHDAFHACAWLLFPHAKARINALHVAEGRDDSPNRRNVVRNVLTLIDEGGLMVVAADAQPLELLRGFRWHELFWRQREQVKTSMDFVIFGHALHERALGLHHGATGRGVLFKVDQAWFGMCREERVRDLDRRLCAVLDDRALLTTPEFIQPVPIKGIPGWAPENLVEDYYFDTTQFRSGRRAVRTC